MRLEVGMIVRLSEQGREKWFHESSNPHNELGVVTHAYVCEFDDAELEWEEGGVDDDNYFPFSVRWGNGKSNSYRWGDLEQVKEIVDRPLEYYL